MAPRPLVTLVAATAVGVLVFGAPNLPGLRAAQTPAPDAVAPAFEVASIKPSGPAGTFSIRRSGYRIATTG